MILDQEPATTGGNGRAGETAPMTPMTATLSTMREVLARRFGIDDPHLDEAKELSALGLDSLAFVEYAFELEKELHIVLPDIPRDMGTVGDLARFVHAEVVKQAAGAAK